MNADLIQKILIFALPVLLSISVHEASHGYAARHFGDSTAAMMGRLTLNPLKHIDPIGTVLIPLVLLWSTNGQFVFGYAKPVPVNFANLRNPKRDMIWVALAGPCSNFVQAIVWALLWGILKVSGVSEPFLLGMCNAGIVVNLVMWAFNLFPLPPLDGGRVLVGLLPYKQAIAVSKLEPYGFFIVMGLVIAGVLGTIWMGPLLSIGFAVINLFLMPFGG